MDETVVEEQAKWILGEECFTVINSELIDASDEMDNCSENNMDALIELGEKWWRDNKNKIEKRFGQ